MRVLCIDPAYGKHAYVGVAIFWEDHGENTLLQVDDIRVPKTGTAQQRAVVVSQFVKEWAWCADIVVAEWPQVYRGGAPAAAQIPMAGVCCAVAALCGAELVTYLPREWKAQVPREAMPDRVRRKLRDDELAICADLGNDGWHAVGLGLFHLKRARRGLP